MADPQSLRRRLVETALPALALALAVVVLFGRTRDFEFADYDETEQITANPLIRGLGPADVWRMFTRPATARPPAGSRPMRTRSI